MTLLVYAVADCPPSQLEGTGIDGVRLAAVEHRGLVAIVGEEAGPEGPVTVDSLWEYERVIEGLAGRHVILPARFGNRLADEEDIRAFLDERHDELSTALERVRGAVELSVNARWRDSGSPPAADREDRGAAYMRGLVTQHRRTAALWHRLEPLAAVARAHRTRASGRPADGVAGAYLIESRRVDEFAELVSQLAGELEEIDVVCTGPWPPYSFADGAQR